MSTVRARVLIALVVAAVAGAAVLSTVWLVGELVEPLSVSGHHDFFALYSAGELIRTHHADQLYTASALTALERQIFPHATGYAGYMPFLNPPSAAALLSPLTALPEASARIVWLCISLVIAAVCVVCIAWRTPRRVWLVAALAVLLTFPAYQTLVEGQWSYVMLAGGLLALRCARRNRAVAAGALLAVFWLKPPLVALILIWLLVTRRWRIAASLIATIVVITAVTLPFTGIAANLNYAGYLLSVSAAHAAGGGAAGATAWEGAFANMEGVLGLAAAIAGQQHVVLVDVLALVFAVLVLAALSTGLLRSSAVSSPPLRIGIAALLTGLLLDPHLYAQDCILLLLPATAVILAMRDRPPAARPAWASPVTVLLATCVVMDLAAIDTLWSQGMFPVALHLCIIAMLAAVAVLTLPLPSALRRQVQGAALLTVPVSSSTTSSDEPSSASP